MTPEPSLTRADRNTDHQPRPASPSGAVRRADDTRTDRRDPAAPHLSRRDALRGAGHAVLLGAGARLLAGGAGAALLAACGSDDGGTASSASAAGTPDGNVLVSFSDTRSSLVPGSPQRVTFGIGDANGALVSDAPATLRFTVRTIDGSPVGEPLDVPSHSQGLPRAYYPVVFTPPQAGSYEVEATLDGTPLTSAFEISPADAVAVPQPGAPLPVFDTPTVADARGVDPICTAPQQCPLHEVNLRDALAQGRRVALLVSTPAYCQTAICGPVLDVVLAARAAAPDVTFIHAEVFASGAAVEAQGVSAPVAPVMEALSLTYEPSLFLVGPDGVLAQRLDVIFDAVELQEALQALSA